MVDALGAGVTSAAPGFETVAIARGTDKEALARRLGAVDYITARPRSYVPG